MKITAAFQRALTGVTGARNRSRLPNWEGEASSVVLTLSETCMMFQIINDDHWPPIIGPATLRRSDASRAVRSNMTRTIAFEPADGSEVAGGT
jgi:hypothetical protein